MPARAALRAALLGDSQMTALGFGTVYAQNAVDSPPEARFVVVRWETPDPPAFAARSRGRASVWFHDKSRDYGFIDKAQERLRQMLPTMVHLAGDDGWTLTAASWNGDSPDLFDDGYGTVVKWSDLMVVSRRV